MERRLSVSVTRKIFFAAMAARFVGYQGHGQDANLVIIALLPSLGSYKKNTMSFNMFVEH